MITSLSLISFSVLACTSAARADEASDLDAFVRAGMKDWTLTGLAISVVKEDRVAFSRGYGTRDIQTGAPVDENTVFQLGSASKPLTATAVALLVQQGKAEWDAPVRSYWPSFQVQDRTVTEQATLRDILCHRTGVGENESTLYYCMPITCKELLARLPDVEQAAQFRTEWRYSNLMYCVAGNVVATISDKGWDESMSTQVFQPLGMTRTATSLKALALLDNVAVPHVRVGDETFSTEFADQDNIGPAAAICSSAGDLSRWLLMMVNGGKIDGKQFLGSAVASEMRKPHILMPADPVHGEHVFNAYGLGLVVWDYHGHQIAAHSGMAGHTLAMIGFVPEKRVGAVVLTNHRRCLFHYAAFRRALDLYCGLPPIDLDSANKRLIGDLVARQKAAIRRREASRDPNKKPTLQQSGYCGRFAGAYGQLGAIDAQAGGLVLTYGNLVADVAHWHDDTFRARLRQRRLADEQDWWLTFDVAEGAVRKLHIHSEHDVQGDFVPVKK
jgi:CubicO group peptidase (beta-lactamase class C family)